MFSCDNILSQFVNWVCKLAKSFINWFLKPNGTSHVSRTKGFVDVFWSNKAVTSSHVYDVGSPLINAVYLIPNIVSKADKPVCVKQ